MKRIRFILYLRTMLRKDAIKNKLTFAIVPNNQLESAIRNIPLRVVETAAAPKTWARLTEWCDFVCVCAKCCPRLLIRRRKKELRALPKWLHSYLGNRFMIFIFFVMIVFLCVCLPFCNFLGPFFTNRIEVKWNDSTEWKRFIEPSFDVSVIF